MITELGVDVENGFASQTGLAVICKFKFKSTSVLPPPVEAALANDLNGSTVIITLATPKLVPSTVFSGILTGMLNP